MEMLQLNTLPLKKRKVSRSDFSQINTVSEKNECAHENKIGMSIQKRSRYSSQYPQVKSLATENSFQHAPKSTKKDEMMMIEKYNKLFKEKVTLETLLSMKEKELKKKVETYSPRSMFDTMWNSRYEELVEFKRQNGHCNVPQRYSHNKALGKWVHKQRQEFKKKREGKATSLTAYRTSALEDLGFKVDTSRRAEALWHQRYKELAEFKKKHGHCNVPQNYALNKSLGKWVHRQRHEAKKFNQNLPSFLTPDRAEALKKIDFYAFLNHVQAKKFSIESEITVPSLKPLLLHEQKQDFKRNLQYDVLLYNRNKQLLEFNIGNENFLQMSPLGISKKLSTPVTLAHGVPFPVGSYHSWTATSA
jgi:hypothetical protein